jgi:Ca2+-binding RTX toxin-like protein
MRRARSIALVLGVVPVLVVAVLVAGGAYGRQGSDCGDTSPVPSPAVTPSNDSDGLEGNDQNNRIDGDNGSDGIIGLKGDDCLSGGQGADTIAGGAGDDTVRGGIGTDVLSGGEDNDVLAGGDGNDQLVDSAGTNTLRGGDGDDVIDAGDPSKLDNPQEATAAQDGTTVLSGGPGDDYINALNGVKDIVRCGEGNDTAIVDLGLDEADSCEWVIQLRSPDLATGTTEIKKPGFQANIKKPG